VPAFRDVLRIIDADADRAREGLRAAEEYARFALDDAAAAEALKRLRHDCAAAVDSLAPASALLESRDSAGDVGADLTIASENRRADSAAVAAANVRRAAEALRVLEEYGKLLPGADSPKNSGAFKALRFRLYEIEKALFLRAPSLADARLYVLITAAHASTDVLTAARESLSGGADILQYREKEMPDREFIATARRLAEICRVAGKPLIINDRAHAAALIPAAGLHLGADDLPPSDARALLGAGRIIGSSTHNAQELAAAIAAPVDYISAGMCFASGTKQRDLCGMDFLRLAARECKGRPLFAIGGITADNVSRLLETGIRRIAVCSAIIGAKDIAAAAGKLRASVTKSGEL
jgi:thiamine-phosphate pyrophosphorylase